MEALATDPGHPELVRRAGIGPVEVLAADGDVLFLDFFCGHNGSENRSDTPRLAFQTRFGGALAEPFSVSSFPYTAGAINTTIW